MAFWHKSYALLDIVQDRRNRLLLFARTVGEKQMTKCTQVALVGIFTYRWRTFLQEEISNKVKMSVYLYLLILFR